MYKKILIANRGEIAVRIIRACRNLGIQSVAVYSTADRDALHVQLADECVCIGEGPAKDSYLNMDRIISAASIVGADAIHPGYGFLSENSDFARKCEEYGIDFIGPSAEIMERMGNKFQARQTMIHAGVPVVPGSKQPVYHAADGKAIAARIGFPVMIKASSGGGGRGIRISESAEDFENQFNTAQRESVTAFADDTMYIEKYIEKSRHVEVQVAADKAGNVVSLGERDCSIQRNHQKLIEESPSPAVNAQMRQEMNAVAVRAAKAVHYYSVGTVEFIVTEDNHFYFMEMNTRVQVEHAVTEMVTGVDLIETQITIAMGLPLSIRQEDIILRGNSLECRINAENPEKKFAPCPGRISHVHFPGGNGVRVDSAIYDGYTVPSAYDSLIAKVIVHGKDRETAIRRMCTALDELVITGISTNINFQYSILHNPVFCKGKADTGFIEAFLEHKV